MAGALADGRGAGGARTEGVLNAVFLHPGGSEHLVLDAATWLCDAGHRVAVHTAHPDPRRAFLETTDDDTRRAFLSSARVVVYSARVPHGVSNVKTSVEPAVGCIA